jgi:hypothetical protein
MTLYPPLGSPEFFAACAEADRHITAGDGKKPVVPRQKRPGMANSRIYSAEIKARAIELVHLYPLKPKAEIQKQIYRETGAHFNPTLISQWMTAYKKKGAKNVKQKT